MRNGSRIVTASGRISIPTVTCTSEDVFRVSATTDNSLTA
jgi:hypothetical protein